VLLLLLLFTLLACGALRLSLTADEPIHLASGYAFLARGQGAMWLIPVRGHPLLVNAWEALPLYLARPDIDLESLPGWQAYHLDYVSSFFSSLGSLERYELAGRVPEILLAVLLAAVVVRWAADLGGRRVALLALGVLVFDPTLLAHGRLATNDVGVVALGTLALFVGWRWWRRPAWPRAAVVGGLLALTMLAKASGALWALAFGLGTIGLGLGERRPVRFWAQGALIVGLAFLGVWAAYGFDVGRLPGIPFPLPASLHWQALLMQQGSPGRRIVFALGMRKQGNWWWYYPLAFLIKNPLPFLVALGVGGMTLLRRLSFSWRILAAGIFPVLYTAAALKWGGNIGYRHMLPLHPFFYLVIALGIETWLLRGGRWVRWVLGGLAVWYVVGTLHVFPDEITFFNAAVGGPEQGYRYLVDSNLDWGQSFKELRDWLAAHPGPRPAIAHLTYVDLDAYGIDYRPIAPSREGLPLDSPFQPAPGRYVIGATPLQGLVGHRTVPPSLDWFRYADPVARVGNGLFVYDVQPYTGTWVAECITPTLPLTEEAAEDRFGRPLRIVPFDCLSSWIYPGGGAQPGWVTLHGYLFPPDGWSQQLLYRPPRPEDHFVARRVEDARLSYRRERATRLPLFALYEVTGPPDVPEPAPVYAAAAGTPPGSLSEPQPLPLDLAGPLVFRGARACREGEVLEVETVWEVSVGGIERPFSIMAHLLAPNGEPLGVADDLGISPLVLEAGDVFVQRHRFADPVGDEVWLQTGAYWLDTLERWPVDGRPGVDTILVPLSPVSGCTAQAPSRVPVWAYGLAILGSAIYLLSLAFGRLNAERTHRSAAWARMLNSACLVLVALIVGRGGVGTPLLPYAALLFGGMLFSFVGDLIIARVLPVPGYPLPGMVAFGVTQVLYLIGYVLAGRALGLTAAWAWGAGVGGSLVLGVVLWRVLIYRPGGNPALAYGSLVYALVLGGMFGAAVALALQAAAFLPLAVGAFLFLVSDALVGNRLLRHNNWLLAGDVVWVLYVAGQTLILFTLPAILPLLNG
jgi:hypothetical protein